MEQADVMAWVLAARHEPEVKQQEEYAEAVRLMEADPNLAKTVEEEAAYYEQQEDYLAFVRLPDDARARIKEQLQAASSPPRGEQLRFPWQRLAVAASLVALVTIGVMNLRPGAAPEVVQAGPHSMDSFIQFAADQVAAGLNLAFRSTDNHALEQWLATEGAPSELALDDRLGANPAMGCAVMEWEGQPVSLVCFRVEGAMVHLFVTPASSLPDAESMVAAASGTHAGREILSWVDQSNAYVLVAHDPGQALSGLSG